MISAFANALTGLNAATRSFAGTAHNVAHYGATAPLAPASVAPVAPPGATGPFRLFDTVNVTASQGEVKAVRFERDPASVPLYAPQSSFADADGLVALANVDLESRNRGFDRVEHVVQGEPVHDRRRRRDARCAARQQGLRILRVSSPVSDC